MKRMTRKPTSPGKILKEEFLVPLRLTQKELADHLGCDLKVINRIVNGRSKVTARMAVRLSAGLGTTPEFWLNAQQAIDLHEALRHLKSLRKRWTKTNAERPSPRHLAPSSGCFFSGGGARRQRPNQCQPPSAEVPPCPPSLRGNRELVTRSRRPEFPPLVAH
jgi:addiction module HigA family antidote